MSARRLVALAALALALVITLVAASEAAPSFEAKKLTASDAQAGDTFGRSVGVSGDTVIVGTVFEDAKGTDAGAVYVYQRGPGGTDNWGEVKKLTAADAQAGDFFGQSVAVSGDTAVVGAVLEDAAGTPTDNFGGAYIFQRDQGGADNWGEVKKLTAADAERKDFFGVGVAVSGDTAVVGAFFEDAGGSNAGAAYVFQRDSGGAGNWGEVMKLIASDSQADDGFGFVVAISGDTVIIGANGEDAEGSNAGAAYIFQRDLGGADNWGEAMKLTASDGDAFDRFGTSVAVSSDTAVVGAFFEDAAGSNAGSGYVFQRDSGGPDNWGEVKKLTASDAETDDQFGVSAAVSGDTAVLGANLEDAGGSDAGAGYVFRRDEGGAGNWGEVKKLTASDGEADDGFASSVAVSGDTAVVGAESEDAGGIQAGAAYVFQQAPPTVTPTATDTPVPPPTPVGGIAVEPELSALGLDAAEASGVDAGAIALVVAAATAGAAMLGAVAVAVARKRRSRRSARGV